MPIVSAQLFVKDLLNGVTPPGDCGIKGPVEALITPYDPDQSGLPRAYVWPSKGDEKRNTPPRNTGMGTSAGWKAETHSLEVFLVWFGLSGGAGADVNFPAFIDYVMDVLRTSPDPYDYTDPMTGRLSVMINLGENMTYRYVPPRSTADQRILRYDASITVPLLEMFQA